ncbi:hypothetical protein BCR35DRAFT_310478 [Leucosporidium creatinivorum]|uniref:MYND-type domain-containing protein n=1 Tax=Leucosporidium creatinivorum TaxID=106004 RepID=A0A1Y2D3Y2_9BASI|nr:hypothetical protein BCR35DRAFT_310478 [Leucosporidium creatinivorum]
MASTSTAPPAPVSLPLRTLQLSAPAHDPTGPAPTVCLARQGDYFVLAHSTLVDDMTPPLWAVLSVMAHEDPFPGFSLGGKGSGEMFWIKTYSENKGILEQLVEAGWVKVTGRTLKQGFVTLPMVEVQLEESEISHQCPHCEMFEQVGDAERFKRCQKCKKRYYCSREHQELDWPEHKKDCKLLALDRRAEVENRKRRETAAYFGEGAEKFTL